MKAFSTLFRVEFRLSLRDMNMPIFAVIMPVVVMLVVGMMFGDQPAYEGASYTFVAQSVGAVSAIGICAGGAMGLPLVVSNYRHRTILKRYFVTPVSVHTILAVQVAIYTVYALISAMLVEFKGMFPDVEKAAFIAPNAAICGDVAMDEGSSVWFSAVIRGEVAPIRIGKNSNVQDNAMLHSDYDCPVTLGDRVSVGHNAIVGVPGKVIRTLDAQTVARNIEHSQEAYIADAQEYARARMVG